MKWEAAVKESPIGYAYRTRADKHITVVNVDKKLFVDTNGKEFSEVGNKQVAKFNDWKPLPESFEQLLSSGNKELGDQMVAGMSKFNDALEQGHSTKGLAIIKTLTEVRDSLSITKFSQPTNPSRDNAISSLASLAAKLVDTDIAYARMVTELLANYLEP